MGAESLRGDDASAFWSYARADDNQTGGLLSRLRECLQAEVRAQTATSFRIYQDVDELAWGDDWGRNIAKAVGAADVLIPVVSPYFFASAACLQEVDTFLTAERLHVGAGQILSIYLRTTSDFEVPATGEAGRIAQILRAHQYQDFRALRNDGVKDKRVVKWIEKVAGELAAKAGLFRRAAIEGSPAVPVIHEVGASILKFPSPTSGQHPDKLGARHRNQEDDVARSEVLDALRSAALNATSASDLIADATPLLEGLFAAARHDLLLSPDALRLARELQCTLEAVTDSGLESDVRRAAARADDLRHWLIDLIVASAK